MHTLSNMLFSKNNDLVLIDFLDSFINSPLMDMVKLRQDTQLTWFYCLYSHKYDENRLNMVLSYIDNKCDIEFSENRYYKKYYLLFQYLNCFRIIPYLKDDRICNKLLLMFNQLELYEK